MPDYILVHPLNNSPAIVSKILPPIFGNALALSRITSRFVYPSIAFASNSKQTRIPKVGSSLSKTSRKETNFNERFSTLKHFARDECQKDREFFANF